MNQEEFFNLYRDRAWPLGTFYIASYRRGLEYARTHGEYVPVGQDPEKAREEFLTTVRDLRKRSRLSQNACVHLIQIRDGVRMMGYVSDYSSVPVCQWVNAKNTNFPWPTGPSHYLDNRRADVRRGTHAPDGTEISRTYADGVPTFAPDDYQPVD